MNMEEKEFSTDKSNSVRDCSKRKKKYAEHFDIHNNGSVLLYNTIIVKLLNITLHFGKGAFNLLVLE